MISKLVAAIKSHDAPKVKKIVDKLPHVHVSKAVKCAVEHGSFAVIEAMPRRWFMGTDQSGLLIDAAKRGHEQICSFLVANHLDLNVQDVELNTSLHYASKDKNKPIMRLLIQNGANPNIRNKDGISPKDYVAFNNEELMTILEENEIAKLLKEKIDTTYMDVQYIKTSACCSHYVNMGPAEEYDNTGIKHDSKGQSVKRPDHVYQVPTCDFFKGDPSRKMYPEELELIQTKYKYILDHLKDDEKIKDIGDIMYSRKALTYDGLQIIQGKRPVTDKVRYLICDVILAGVNLGRFLEFTRALKDVGEEVMASKLEKPTQMTTSTNL